MARIPVRRHIRRTPLDSPHPFCRVPRDIDIPVNLSFQNLEATTFKEFSEKYGFNDTRRRLIRGLRHMLDMYRDPNLVGRHQDIQEVAVYGSFVSGKETPRDIDVIIHSHSPISLPDQVRWKLMDYAEAHDIDIIYMTSETLYWRYLEFAADRYGKVVRMRF